MDKQTAIDLYACAVLADVINEHKRTDPERFERMSRENPDFADKFLIKQTASGTILADTIMADDKRPLIERVNRGAFDSHNRRSRQLFFNLTGIFLPKTNAETHKTIFSFIGSDVVNKVNRIATEKREQEELEAQRRKQEAEDKRIDVIKNKFVSNEPVSGEELVILAKFLTIEVHPATIGLCRKRVVSIQDGTARVIKGGSCQSAHELYTKVKIALSALKE